MTTLYGNPVPPNFNDGEELSAAEFNAVKNYWVTDELPDTAEDGDVVFVVESDPFDPNATPGLPGIGGWATITGVSGDYNKYSYGDWVAYEFTDDGFVTTDEGLVECLVVAGGGGSTGPYTGGGGGMLERLLLLEGDTHDVVVGAGGTPATRGGNSRLATLEALGGGGAMATDGTPAQRPGGSGGGGVTGGGPGLGVPGQGHNAVSQKGGGAGGSPGSQFAPPRASSIADGNPRYYSAGNADDGYNPTPNSGNGAGWGQGTSANSQSGSSGVVIVRVPATNATATRENPHGWLNFATVENGVVTSVNKTPDNIPYTTAVDEIPCGPEVAEGWNYDGSEFVAPKPDHSEQIKELEETLKNLRSAK